MQQGLNVGAGQPGQPGQAIGTGAAGCIFGNIGGNGAAGAHRRTERANGNANRRPTEFPGSRKPLRSNNPRSK